MSPYDPLDEQPKRRRKKREEPSLFDALQARDEGVERVTENAGMSFAAAIHAIVRAYPKGKRFIGEDVRLDAEAAGVFPHHPNAWGGVFASIVKSGMVKETGRIVQPKSTKSHACRKPEWERV